MANVDYEIKEKIAVLGEMNNGWTKELNLVSWNKAAARLDIRGWSPDHDKMGKGLTLSMDEAVKLKDALVEYTHSYSADVLAKGDA